MNKEVLRKSFFHGLDLEFFHPFLAASSFTVHIKGEGWFVEVFKYFLNRLEYL